VPKRAKRGASDIKKQAFRCVSLPPAAWLPALQTSPLSPQQGQLASQGPVNHVTRLHPWPLGTLGSIHVAGVRNVAGSDRHPTDIVAIAMNIDIGFCRAHTHHANFKISGSRMLFSDTAPVRLLVTDAATSTRPTSSSEQLD